MSQECLRCISVYREVGTHITVEQYSQGLEQHMLPSIPQGRPFNNKIPNHILHIFQQRELWRFWKTDIKLLLMDAARSQLISGIELSFTRLAKMILGGKRQLIYVTEMQVVMTWLNFNE